MTSKQTSDSKNHNPEGHNQYTENKSSGTRGHQGNSSGSSNSSSHNSSGSAKNASSSYSGGTQGGTHEQHVKAGQKSHKNS